MKDVLICRLRGRGEGGMRNRHTVRNGSKEITTGRKNDTSEENVDGRNAPELSNSYEDCAWGAILKEHCAIERFLKIYIVCMGYHA